MKRLFIILTAVLAFAACQKPIDFYGDETSRCVVVNALAQEDSTFCARLTFSRFFLSNKPFEEITNASLVLNVNGSDYAASYRDSGNYEFNYIPQPGDSLTLTAIVPGYDPITASTRVPKRPVVKEVTGDRRLINENYSEHYIYEIKFKLEDDANERNYYRLKVRLRDTCCERRFSNYDYNTSTYQDTILDTLYYNYSKCSYTLEDMYIVDEEVLGSLVNSLNGDAQGSYYGQELLFTDDKINGKTHEIKLNIDRYNDSYYYNNILVWQNIAFDVVLESLSEEYFYYLVTTHKQLDNDELAGIISEPTAIISNVKGGIGVLGATSCFTESLRYHFVYEDSDNR